MGMIPIGIPPQGKNEPKKESPEGGKGDKDHQPPQAGGDATAEGGGGVMVQFNPFMFICLLGKRTTISPFFFSQKTFFFS